MPAALLAVCLPLGSGAVCNYLESCQLCRLQRPKVNIIGPITKLITFSVATVCGASLAAAFLARRFACRSFHSRGHRRPAQKQLRSGGPASCVFPMVHRSATSAISLFPMAPPASNIFPMALRRSATAGNNFATASLPATNLIRRRKVLRFG